MDKKSENKWNVSFLRERMCYLEHGVDNDLDDQILDNIIG